MRTTLSVDLYNILLHRNVTAARTRMTARWPFGLPDAEPRVVVGGRCKQNNHRIKRHGPFVAFYFYCKIMLYGIN